MSEEKSDKEAAAPPGAPAPQKGGPDAPRVPKEGLPTLVRPISAEKVVSRLPRPPVPLPPPSEPKTLIKGEAVKLPLPPVVASRPPAPPPEGTQAGEPADLAGQTPPPPGTRTTSVPPPLPRTGFMTAVDSVKPLLDNTRASLAPALAKWRSLAGRAAGAVPEPAREWIRIRFERIRAALPPGAQETLRRRPRLVPVVTIGVLLVALGLVGLVVSLIGRLFTGGAESSRAPSSAVSAPASPAAAAPASTAPCTVAGPARVVAPSAVVAAGVEARTLGDGVALGFAPSAREGAAVRLDPANAAPTGNATSLSDDPVRRVRPALGAKDALGLTVDSDSPGDRVHGRRSLPLDARLQAGAAGTDIVWTRPGGPPAGKLWSVDRTAEDLDALRAASETFAGETTTALTFRRANALWVGAAIGTDSLAPKGALSHVSGLGPVIGSPAVAIDEGVVMLAWADRASPAVPWSLRLAHMKAGEPAGEPVSFAPPAGGPGGQVMSPGLTALPGGRFLIVWTEGPGQQQRVRALTLTRSGEPLGNALEISTEGVNSGQGQAAVTASAGGRGVVAYLQSSKEGFEVAATPIACAP